MSNRIIKESICTSDNLDGLTSAAEVLFIRLITQSDDFGRFDARSLIVRGRCFPLKTNLSNQDIEQWISELVTHKLIRVYEVDGIPYGEFINWEKHQRVRNKRSKIPPPNGHIDNFNPYYLARFIPTERRIAIFKRDNYQCLACHTSDSVENPLSIDHITPVSLGGTSDESNLQTLCLRCNLIKNTKTIDYRIVASSSYSQHIAADGDKPQQFAVQSNPIQSESNPNTNPIQSNPENDVIEKSLKNVYVSYENNIGMLTPMISEQLSDAVKEYSEQWIIDAIKVAINHNARKWAYIHSVLERWKTNGHTNGEVGEYSKKDEIKQKTDPETERLKNSIGKPL